MHVHTGTRIHIHTRDSAGSSKQCANQHADVGRADQLVFLHTSLLSLSPSKLSPYLKFLAPALHSVALKLSFCVACCLSVFLSVCVCVCVGVLVQFQLMLSWPWVFVAVVIYCNFYTLFYCVQLHSAHVRLYSHVLVCATHLCHRSICI